MADQEPDNKETEAAKPDSEKTEPTADEGSKPASPTKSRQSKSPKGRPDSKTSERTSSRAKSPKSARAKSPKSGRAQKGDKMKTKKKRKKKKDELKVDEVTKEETPEPGTLPEGAEPIFLASKTQEIFQCQTDVDVTEESPFKLLKKEDIITDMRTRAAVSDFSPFKAVIQDYPAEEILIVYDIDFKFGQNFYIALTEETKERILNPPVTDEEGGGRAEDEEQVVYQYVPPVAKDWVSFGSENEIVEETLKYNRSKISMSVKRVRRDFGRPVTFTDRNVGDAKDGYIECASAEDANFNISKMEKDTAVQAIPDFVSSGTQTDWKYPRNNYTQYMPRNFTESERDEYLKNEDLKKFVVDSLPRFELALQQNGIMDVFFNDWENLGDEDTTFGGKSDNHLKEYQSFTDLKFSKRKTITSIDWHPTVKGLIGVSCAERMNFDERIDHSAKIILNPSLILIWSFVDPINPMLLLEAPDDILCFKFNPVNPNIVAGGCINGQVVMWDVSAYAERLKAQRTSREVKKDSLNSLPGFDDGSGLDTPIVRYSAVSSIEHSHKAAITDLLWIPDHYDLNRMGVPQENRSQECSQLMTCATDHCILVWDIKAPKTNQTTDAKKDDRKNPSGVSLMFKHLDLTWKPILKVYLTRSEPGGDHSPVKFSVQERQGDRNVLNKTSDNKVEREASSGGFNFGKPASGKEKRTLTEVTTKFYVGGEDGEVIYADWMPQKDQDSGKVMTPKPVFYNSCHDGPIVSLQRSPFFKDILLCVGGWSFSIWKEGVNSGPILVTNAQSKKLTSGFWSPSRPGVLYIACEDGNIHIWDFLDRTHEPSQTQNVSANPITCIFPYSLTNKQHLLAVGDTSGTLHVLEIPWSLRHPVPNELNGITNYFEREVKRRAFVMARWDYRENEKRQIEAEAKMKAGIAPNVQLTEEELEYKMKQEYNAYLEEELSFLRELGLVKEEEEPLPEV